MSGDTTARPRWLERIAQAHEARDRVAATVEAVPALVARRETVKRHRARVPGSKRNLREHGGWSLGLQWRVEQHVTLVDRYPELHPFSQRAVLCFGRFLDGLRRDDPLRATVRAILTAREPEMLRRLAAAIRGRPARVPRWLEPTPPACPAAETGPDAPAVEVDG